VESSKWKVVRKRLKKSIALSSKITNPRSRLESGVALHLSQTVSRLIQLQNGAKIVCPFLVFVSTFFLPTVFAFPFHFLLSTFNCFYSFPLTHSNEFSAAPFLRLFNPFRLTAKPKIRKLASLKQANL